MTSIDPVVLERVAQRFWREMWRSVIPDAVIESGVQAKRFGPIQATAFGDLPRARFLNQIRGAAEPGALEGDRLAEAVEWMRERELDYCIPVAEVRPGAAEAEAWLGSRGYERASCWVKLTRDASLPLPPEDPGIAIFELGEDEIDGEGLSSIAAQALELPVMAGTLFFSLPQTANWRCYTAALEPGGPPVATGAMLIEDGIAQLGPGTTLEQARGRGCNTALVRRRVLDAAAAGCHTVFVEICSRANGCLAQSEQVFRSAGFMPAYESRIWQRPALRAARVG